MIIRKVFEDMKVILTKSDSSCGNLKGKVNKVKRVVLLPVNSLNLIKLIILEQGHRSTIRNFLKNAEKLRHMLATDFSQNIDLSKLYSTKTMNCEFSWSSIGHFEDKYCD